MKKFDIWLIVLLGLLVVLGVGIYVIDKKNSNEGDPSVWVDTPPAKVEAAATPGADEAGQRLITLPTANSKYTDLGGGLHQISGKVTNTSSRTRSVVVIVTYYNQKNEPIEGGASSYSDILPGASLDYSVTTPRDVSGFKSFAVQATTFTAADVN